jgi:hypothetical protein
MLSRLKEIAQHSIGVSAMVLVIFFFATAFTYVEDLLKAWHRPEWLQEGVAAISIGLFILDGVLIVGAAGIATMHILRSMLQDLK